MHHNDTCRLQSQLSEKDVMVSKVQPELLRQCSINKLLGANSVTLQNGGAAARSSEVMHIVVTVLDVHSSNYFTILLL